MGRRPGEQWPSTARWWWSDRLPGNQHIYRAMGRRRYNFTRKIKQWLGVAEAARALTDLTLLGGDPLGRGALNVIMRRCAVSRPTACRYRQMIYRLPIRRTYWEGPSVI